MKVAIKGKGEEFKYIKLDDILDPIKKDFDDKLVSLANIIKAQQTIIDNINNELKIIKLENIKIVKGLIQR